MDHQTKPYAVNFWGSKPGTNDDCWTGLDFATREDAVAAFESRPMDIAPYADAVSTAWIEIDGPDIHDARPNPDYDSRADGHDDDWHQEQRMQAAMAFGVQGWNDYQGA